MTVFPESVHVRASFPLSYVINILGFRISNGRDITKISRKMSPRAFPIDPKSKTINCLIHISQTPYQNYTSIWSKRFAHRKAEHEMPLLNLKGGYYRNHFAYIMPEICNILVHYLGYHERNSFFKHFPL